ncbi:MAG: Superoxide dismutase [Thermoleophilia bacterium]|nr:Superoxide dismutase [Thermoleophilia bacterium]
MATATAWPLQGGDIKTIEWNDAWTSLTGISETTMRNHWKLYEGYVGKWKEANEKLKSADLSTANQIVSDWRALKTDITFAIGGVKNHQLYFSLLGGDGSAPTGWLAEAIDKQWGSFDALKADLKATAMAGRGWAWLAFDWETNLLGTYLGDTQNTFPIWNATPLVALDVYEHAYFTDFGTDRPGYIDAFFANLDWNAVVEVAETFEIQQRFSS